MAKSVKVGSVRLGTARQKRTDGRGSKISLYTYRSTGKPSVKKTKP